MQRSRERMPSIAVSSLIFLRNCFGEFCIIGKIEWESGIAGLREDDFVK
jgi:hypothetical protein